MDYVKEQSELGLTVILLDWSHLSQISGITRFDL